MQSAGSNSIKTLVALPGKYWQKLLYLGVKPGMATRDTQKTLVINVLLIGALPLVTWFCIINFLNENYLLGLLNLLCVIIYAGLWFTNYYQRGFGARFPLLLLLASVFTLEALVFKNGGEYFLLMMVLAATIIFDSQLTYLFFSVIVIGVFTWVRITLTPAPDGVALSHSRIIANLVTASIFMVLTAQYFKSLVYNYQVKLEKSNNQLKEVNATMQKLFSIVAHDLRSPIAALNYSLTLLNDESITGEEFLYLSKKLNGDVSQLQYNLDNLLRWSITQLHGIEVKPKEIMAEEAVNDIIAFYRQMLLQKDIHITTEYAPDVKVMADPDHFALIMRNLLSNAIKFSYPGAAVNIRVKTDQHLAYIAIEDKGTGMNEQVKDQLFLGIKGGSLSGTRNEKGTGLGLLLCKEFAERNNSIIRVQSFPGKGSIFTWCVPLAV